MTNKSPVTPTDKSVAPSDKSTTVSDKSVAASDKSLGGSATTPSPGAVKPSTDKSRSKPADSGAGTEKTAVHPESTGNEDPGSELNSPPQRDKIK